MIKAKLKTIGDALFGKRSERLQSQNEAAIMKLSNIHASLSGIMRHMAENKAGNKDLRDRIIDMRKRIERIDDTCATLIRKANKLYSTVGMDIPLAQIDKMVAEVDRYMRRESVKTILDVGTRDAETAIALKRFFWQAKIFAFECNPEAIAACKGNIKNCGHEDIFLVEKAVSAKTGVRNFYAINSARSKNIGASSLFRPGPFNNEKHFKRIKVDSVLLDDWLKERGIKGIDILWMDLQGAELEALHSLRRTIKKVKFISTEVEYREMYLGQPLYADVEKFLFSQGFRLQRILFTNKNMLYGNILYRNAKLIK